MSLKLYSWLHFPSGPVRFRRIVLETNCCVDLAVFLGAASTGLLSISHTRLTVEDFRQPLVRASALHVFELREFTASAYVESKFSVNALMLSEKDGVLKST